MAEENKSGKKTFILCLDDSGTRHPTHKVGRRPKHGYDWFALGGVIFDECDESVIRLAHAKFIQKWSISAPLHSSEIRARAEAFSFIGRLEKSEQQRFYEELYQLMATIPVYGFGCVVDRPSYNERYLTKYEQTKRWLLCKSAFTIVVERAAKYANANGARLRVYIERADKKTDRRMNEYYNSMRTTGMPFSESTSEKYDPAEQEMLARTLFEFRTKAKSSPLMQLSDLYAWPIAMGGYNPDCLPYLRLNEDRKLLDNHLDEKLRPTLGIKYYCFDMQKPGP